MSLRKTITELHHFFQDSINNLLPLAKGDFLQRIMVNEVVKSSEYVNKAMMTRSVPELEDALLKIMQRFENVERAHLQFDQKKPSLLACRYDFLPHPEHAILLNRQSKKKTS